jgi:hypothetical protein
MNFRTAAEIKSGGHTAAGLVVTWGIIFGFYVGLIGWICYKGGPKPPKPINKA